MRLTTLFASLLMYGCLSVPCRVVQSAPANAVKLWPQITSGIYNHAGVLAMRCEVAKDGLTVTDAAWDSYHVEGCAKRWTLDMGSPMDGPLKNYRFAPEFSGLPVNLCRVLQPRQTVGGEGELSGDSPVGR